MTSDLLSYISGGILIPPIPPQPVRLHSQSRSVARLRVSTFTKSGVHDPLYHHSLSRSLRVSIEDFMSRVVA